MEPPRLRNIILIGFMGCGKSTIGRSLASTLGFRFADTDELVAAEARAPITKIFEREGEDGFRRRETATLVALDGTEGQVISTGGGIVTREENAPLLRRLGYIVWLAVGEDEIYRRVSRNRDRPLLHTPNPRKTIHDLMAKRDPLYAAAADMKVKTEGLSISDVAYGIAESARVFFANAAHSGD
ncbi:MAG: shikimate kinase [Verrucomicrobiales bacterium]